MQESKLIMNDYKTKDFYFAAYLMASGMELKECTRDGALSTFVFTNSENLQNLIIQFYGSEALVNPITYGHSLRELKGMIHTTKPTNNYVKQPTNTK